MEKKYQKILWIFNYPNPNDIPSYVVGGIMPANILGIKKIIFLENHDPVKFLSNAKPKAIIISKAFNKNIHNLVNFAYEKKIKIISVFDDWNFDSFSRTDKSKINLPIAEKSDCIIVKTETASKVLYENTKLSSFVIPDMLRFRSYEPISCIRYPFEVTWFGMPTNHDTLVSELKNIDASNIKINLRVITSHTNIIKNKITNLNLKNIDSQFIDWTPEFNKEIIKSDIVILPYAEDQERLVKSSNRIIDSLNLGRFVILSNVEQFKEFEHYTYFGNINNGLEWLKLNKAIAIDKILKGQKYVNEFYSPESVIQLWRKIINKVLI